MGLLDILTVPRLICIFSLVLFCVDTGSDIFVAADLHEKCHYRYFASVILLVILPGIIYGWFEYFRIDKGNREWKDVLKYLVLCPIFFIPKSFWDLLSAVYYNGDTEFGHASDPSDAEDDAKWYFFHYSRGVHLFVCLSIRPNT